MRVLLFAGSNMTFLNESTDGETKAIIDTALNSIILDLPEAEAEEVGEQLITQIADSYIVPELYKHPIKIKQDKGLDKTLFDQINKYWEIGEGIEMWYHKYSSCNEIQFIQDILVAYDVGEIHKEDKDLFEGYRYNLTQALLDALLAIRHLYEQYYVVKPKYVVFQSKYKGRGRHSTKDKFYILQQKDRAEKLLYKWAQHKKTVTAGIATISASTDHTPRN